MMGRVFPRHDFFVIEIEKYMWMKTVEYLDNLFSVGRRKVATWEKVLYSIPCY